MNNITDLTEIFPWNDNFDTGIHSIDEQHQRLVQLLNKLATHLAYQSDPAMMEEVFDELTAYAVYHLQSEEQVWHTYLPEDALEAAHQKEHEKFISSVQEIMRGNPDKSVEQLYEQTLSFLSHWLAFHILESDKHLSLVVHAVESGMSLEQAKDYADKEMKGARGVLVETVLSMYDTLSSRTLQLIKEIAERQRTEAKLRLAAAVFDNTLESISITDAQRTVIDVNPAFTHATGFSREEIIGQSLMQLKANSANDSQADERWLTLQEQGHWSGSVVCRDKQGAIGEEWLTLTAIKDTNGDVSNYVAVFSSVSDLIKNQKELERIAHHDTLTGLPNRLLLSDRLQLATAHAERNQSRIAVCYLDLDGFKLVNDQYGHAAGDDLLREIGLRLTRVVRSEDTVARLGGDEFVILLTELELQEDYMALIERVLQEIDKPIETQGHTVTVSASIGIAIYPDNATEVQQLLQQADNAMYQAKRLGRNRYHGYDTPNS
jgi:diguanylate cyclase (GGDEF)-like protein/hemerythrin-like metal-binding protein/PAS domain S-box-containing protein